MSSSSWYRSGWTAAAPLLLVGCASAFDPFALAPLRTGSALPPRFEPPASLTRVAPADTLPGSGCLNPMRDPRDGAEIILVRASTPRADYAVQGGRYGVGADELLRLDCNTGEPIGIVRR